MKVEVQKSFEKDIEKISNKKLAEQVNALIEDLENCSSLSEIRNVKKMKAKGSYYRIRIGNYRLGLKQEKESSFSFASWTEKTSTPISLSMKS